MKKLIAGIAATVLAAFAASTFAGIAPANGNSAAMQSGAKIAPAKPAAEDDKKEHQSETKDQAK